MSRKLSPIIPSYWVVRSENKGRLLGVYPSRLYDDTEQVITRHRKEADHFTVELENGLTPTKRKLLDEGENERLGFSAEQLLAAYPNNDLCAIAPAKKGESVHSYRERCDDEVADCGDSILKFIIYESGDDCANMEEFLNRMARGVRDIESVAHAIQYGVE